jgi:hypothetical protein
MFPQAMTIVNLASDLLQHIVWLLSHWVEWAPSYIPLTKAITSTFSVENSTELWQAPRCATQMAWAAGHAVSIPPVAVSFLRFSSLSGTCLSSLCAPWGGGQGSGSGTTSGHWLWVVQKGPVISFGSGWGFVTLWRFSLPNPAFFLFVCKEGTYILQPAD